MSQPSASAARGGAARSALPSPGLSGTPSLAASLAIGAILIAIVLRAYALGGQPLWRDESLVYWLSRESLGHLTSRDLALTGTHPPLFYILHSVWERLLSILSIEKSEVSLRALSVIIGSLTVSVYYLLVRRLFDPPIAAIACLLLAVSGHHILFSRETKSEVLSIFLSMFCYWSTVELAAMLIQPYAAVRRRDFYLLAAVYIICSIAALYAHSAGFCVLIVSGSIFLAYQISSGRHLSQALLAWTVINSIVILAFIPWVDLLMHVARNRVGYYWFEKVPPLEALKLTAKSYGFPGLYLSHPVGAPLIFLLSIGFARAVLYDAKSRAIALSLIIFPVILFIISFEVPIFLDRVIIPYTLFPVLLVYAIGIRYLFDFKITRFLAILLLCLATILSLRNVYDQKKEPWNLVAAYLKQTLKPSEPVLLWPAYAEWSLRYYLPADTSRWASVELGDGRIEFRPFRTVAVVDRGRIAAFLGDSDSVWLVEDKKELGWSETLQSQLAALYPRREAKLFPSGLIAEHFFR